MRIRPCIDLKDGRVVQIVGGTLKAPPTVGAAGDETVVNFASERPASEFAALYKDDGLGGGHIIALGPGNEEAALDALRAFPGGMQMGGGVRPENAHRYLDAGASHVIVTSYVFRDGQIDTNRLAEMVQSVGKTRLVLDLSCRRRGNDYFVVTDRWQRFTDLRITSETLTSLSQHCDEFLVHAVDVEGKRAGIDADLLTRLTDSPIPLTYAGGVSTWDDIHTIETVGEGRIDLTVGSALDIFGGSLSYRDLAKWQQKSAENTPV
ncbi:MAG: phosphoribosylformimino-5-aminoimidazole carboxamide ribotide isomerase [Armatimonadota bacterium]